jgi:hypothetical protein
MHAKPGPTPWFRLALLSAVASGACGETRTLDLFSKKEAEMPPPAPLPSAACGVTAMCPVERSVCLDGQCVQCAEDVDCTAKHACVANTCVECTTDEHCPMKKVCDTVAGSCTEPCTAPESCKDMNRKVCDVERAWCVQCLQHTDCDATHVCDPARSVCVGCVSNTDCGDSGVCDVERSECSLPPPAP